MLQTSDLGPWTKFPDFPPRPGSGLLAPDVQPAAPLQSIPRILPTHDAGLFEAAVCAAAEELAAGGVVAIPTETVYGLAANALDAAAVRRIYEIKGRPSHNPIIVHVASLAMARRCVAHWPEEASRLAAAFWPGPLTLVLPRSEQIPDVVTAGGSSVGIRWPSHPFAQAVIRACDRPLAAPSANRANAISPTTAEHVAASLGASISTVVDGGPCQVGVESTVLDLTVSPARVLRPGMIHDESLRAVVELAGPQGTGCGDPSTSSAGPLRSPGLLARHYAPRARLVRLAWANDRELSDQMRGLGADPATTHVLSHAVVPSQPVATRICVIPHDAEAYARAMYAEWHRCDELGARTIVVEEVPAGAEWGAIRDRLRRAAKAES